MTRITNPKFLEVKTAMLLHMPFFASLLLDIMQVKVGKFPGLFPPGQKETAATDGKWIYFDEDFLNSLTTKEAVGLTCHEVSHAMWEHMARGKHYLDLGFDGEPFQPILWNIAGDYIINDMLIKSGMTLPEGGCVDPQYTMDMAIEDVYRALRKRQKEQQKKGKGKGQPGESGIPGVDPGEFDHHVFDTAKLSPAEMKRAIQSAIDTAKACGNLPGALQRLAEALVEPTVEWREKLRHLVTTRAARDTSTWALPHKRRLASQRLYLARPSSYGCRDIVVAIDTSGSIGPKELTAFLSELADIMRSCRPERVFVLGADAAVASVEELAGDVDISTNPPTVGGGGGTDFRPVFDWVEKQGLVPDCLVYLTDAYGPFPGAPPEYPVIWGVTTTQAVPWGERVDVKV